LVFQQDRLGVDLDDLLVSDYPLLIRLEPRQARKAPAAPRTVPAATD
jgi:hypothetical protein